MTLCALVLIPEDLLCPRKAASNGSINNRQLLRRLQGIDKLSAHQKRLLLGTIDTFLKASGSR